MKKLLMIFLFLLLIGRVTYASEFDSLIPSTRYDETYEIWGKSSLSELTDSIINGETSDYGGILKKIADYFVKDLKDGIKYTAAIIGFAMFTACIKGADFKFLKGGGELVFLICYCVISAFLLAALKNSVNTSASAAKKVIGFVQMCVPAYIGFTSAMFPAFKAAGTDGIFLLMTNVMSTFAGKFMLGIFFNLGLLSIVNHMSKEIHIIRLSELVRQTVFWILGFLLTVFAGMTGFSGLTANAVTSSGMKAVKYTVGNTVPVVGGFLADSSEMILASAALFKNAFGTAGIIVIFTLCVIPVIKLFSVGVLLKAAAGLTEPFCDKRISDCIADIARCITDMMICVILLSVMFIFALSVLLIVGNGG